MKLFISALFFVIVILPGTIYADCSFKVINNTTPSFEEQNAVGTIGNLLIPLCTHNPSHDEETRANCATNVDNTLYEHPHEESSCISTQGQFVYIQFSDKKKVCISFKPQTGGYVILNFPDDFGCSFEIYANTPHRSVTPQNFGQPS